VTESVVASLQTGAVSKERVYCLYWHDIAGSGQQPERRFVFCGIGALRRDSHYVISSLIRRRFLHAPKGLLADGLPVAGDRNHPTLERVTVPSNLDCIEQVNSSRTTIARNLDRYAAIMWHIILLNGSGV